MKLRQALRARYVLAGYVAAESTSFASHQYRMHRMENAPRRTMEEGFDYDGHHAWFAKELRHEPNPRRLFQDAFNDVPVEAIPRDAALRMIQFFLSARELHEFPEGKYPADVTRTSEKLLKDFERGHGLRFRSEFVVNLGPDQGGERTVRTPITPETEQKLRKTTEGEQRAFPAMTSFLTSGGVSTGAVETTRTLTHDVDFIRPNKFALSGWYKPLALQALIGITRWYGKIRLERAGFVQTHDASTDCDLWVRPRVGEDGDGLNPDDPNRHDPVVFLHGLGVGLAPYADYVADHLPKDRPVVAPEWPNISYGRDRCYRYPTPTEFADFLKRSVTAVHVASVAAEECEGGETRGADDSSSKSSSKTSSKTLSSSRKRRHSEGKYSYGSGDESPDGDSQPTFACDLIAHSYGTVILTAFRRHHPRLTRRCVYVDPVCFLPSFGSYLRYAHDDHLASMYELVTHLAARGADPTEPMSMANLVLASWFVKGDPSTQQLMKRLLFPHEAWERGPLGDDDMVVLSGLDDIVASAEIAHRFRNAWPKCSVLTQPQWQHGGFLLEPDPDGINAKIVRFVEGGHEDDDGSDGGKMRDENENERRFGVGAVRRAWRFALHKKRRTRLKQRDEVGQRAAEGGGAVVRTDDRAALAATG